MPHSLSLFPSLPTPLPSFSCFRIGPVAPAPVLVPPPPSVSGRYSVVSLLSLSADTRALSPSLLQTHHHAIKKRKLDLGTGPAAPLVSLAGWCGRERERGVCVCVCTRHLPHFLSCPSPPLHGVSKGFRYTSLTHSLTERERESHRERDTQRDRVFLFPFVRRLRDCFPSWLSSVCICVCLR